MAPPFKGTYLILTSVELTFRIFIGIADPVPRKTTSGYWLQVSMEKHIVSQPWG